MDGTYELFRAYYGAPPAEPRRARGGGAARGLVRSLLALLLRDDGVTHVAVAFDHVIESFRNDALRRLQDRRGLPADLMAQFPLAETRRASLGVVVWPMVEFEADDALATAAARFARCRRSSRS